MRVVLTGGGTGGHIYPAVAIGQAILQKWPQCEILYIGAEKGLENKIIPQVGFPLVTLAVEGWHRKISPQLVRAVWKAGKAFWRARHLLRDFKPDLVIGTGGYVSFPVAAAAFSRHIPVILHEQNSLPGLANRLLAGGAREILLTFPAARFRFSARQQKKMTVTGLPVRPIILEQEREAGLSFFGFSPDKLTLLGVGGSQGARNINYAMLFVCRKYGHDPRVQIIHLTGEADYPIFQQRLTEWGIDVANNGNIIITPYLLEMEYALACADLCVGRSGAAFLAEITAKGIPGILIPYRYSAGGHQKFNAQALEEQGAVAVIPDNELTGDVLAQKIEKLLSDDAYRQSMAQKSKEAGKPAAIDQIMALVEPYLTKK